MSNNTQSMTTRQVTRTRERLIHVAAKIAEGRLAHVNRANMLFYREREALKRDAWNRLHAGAVIPANIADILTAWGHREVSHFDERAKPNLATLEEWAGEVLETIERVRELRGEGSYA